MLLGGHVGDLAIEFGDKAVKLPAKTAAQAVVRIVGRFADERGSGESFTDWLARSGGASGVGETVKDLDEFPDPEQAPEFYVDFGETGPYVKAVGDSECAT
jgi:sulfite reductase beta subunit-like hemoprotein